MARHSLPRFLLTVPALWLVLTMDFLRIDIVPGDPVEQMLGESAVPGQAAELAGGAENCLDSWGTGRVYHSRTTLCWQRM